MAPPQQQTSWLRAIGRARPVYLGRHLLQWMVFVLCGVGVGFVICGAPIKDVTGAAVFGALGILVISAPVGLLREYTSQGFEVGGFGLSAKLPAVRSQPLEEGDTPARDLIDLRLNLEMKMTYPAKHVLGPPRQPADVTLGSLVHDGRLESTKAEVLALVSSLRVPSSRDREAGESLSEWLVRAQRLVSTLRIDVLSRTILTRLNKAEMGGRALFRVDGDAGIAETPRAIRVALADAPQTYVIVVPVFSRPPDGRIHVRMADRVARLGFPAVLVCPPDPSTGAVDEGSHDGAILLPSVVQEVYRLLKVQTV